MPSARPHKPARPHLGGFTLIEILIVVLIMAVAVTGVTMSIGALTRTELRSACMKVVAASKYAYNRAIVKGNTVRIRFDFRKHTLGLEEAHGRVALAQKDDERRVDDEEGETNAAVDPWEAARARLEETFEPTLGQSPFGPIRGPEGNVVERYKPQSLGDGIRIVRLHVPHAQDPIETGKGAIHFFPGGRTEHAVAQLSDDAGETIYSVEIHPLTGRGKVYRKAYEPEEMDANEFSELRDPE